MKSSLESPNRPIADIPSEDARPRPIVMERRHLFGNRLRWAAEVIREERRQRRNRQEKLF